MDFPVSIDCKILYKHLFCPNRPWAAWPQGAGLSPCHWEPATGSTKWPSMMISWKNAWCGHWTSEQAVCIPPDLEDSNSHLSKGLYKQGQFSNNVNIGVLSFYSLKVLPANSFPSRKIISYCVYNEYRGQHLQWSSFETKPLDSDRHMVAAEDAATEKKPRKTIHMTEVWNPYNITIIFLSQMRN